MLIKKAIGKFSFKQIFALITLVGVSFAWHYINSKDGVNFLDTGFIMNSSKRIANGEVPYKDFFTLITPIYFYVGALFIKIFGSGLLPFYIYGSLTCAGISTCVFYIVKHITRNRFTALLAYLCANTLGLTMTATTSGYTWLAVFFALSATYLLLMAEQKRSGTMYFLTGMVLSLVFLSKQTIGVYLVLATGAYLLLTRRSRKKREVMFLAGGLGLVILSFIALLFLNSTFSTFLNNTVFYPFSSFGAEAGIRPPQLSEISTTWIGYESALFYVFVISIIFSWLVIYKKRPKISQPIDNGILLVTLCATFMILLCFERYSFYKLRAVLPFGILSSCVVVFVYLGTTGKRLYVVAGALLIMSGLLYTKFTPFNLPNRTYVSIKGNTVKMTQDEYVRIKAMTDFIDSHTGKVVVLPQSPLVYYFSTKPNPTRNDLVIPANMPELDRLELKKTLATEIDYVLFDSNYSSFDGREFSEYYPDIWQTLNNCFDIESNTLAGGILELVNNSSCRNTEP